MNKTIVIGEDFATLRKTNGYYVDKTELLYELVHDTNNAVSVFTRSSGFGKTLTMSMIESFFSIFKKNSADLFNDLAVWKHSEFCRKWMNQYPVIYISLKDVEGQTLELAYDKLKSVIASLCVKYSFLTDNDKVNTYDKETFQKLKYQTGTESDVCTALKTIMHMMNVAYGRKVILLIDDYDFPLMKANANGYYSHMSDVIRAMMSTSLKTNEYLEFAVMTGCFPIPKEISDQAMNHFVSYSVLDTDFSHYFGFTEDEVKELLDSFRLTDKETFVQEWYGGYLAGNSKVYCPWNVVNYVAALTDINQEKQMNYLNNSTSRDAIEALLDFPDADVSDEFETLLNGGTIHETITNTLTYDHAYESLHNLWNILLMTGYLTHAKTNETGEEGNLQIELRIPNRKIAGIFQSAVADHFNKTLDQKEIRDLMNALWNADESAASTILSDLLWNTISCNHYKEDYYHTFLTCIFASIGDCSVRMIKGLCIDLRDKKNRRAMIIKVKIADIENHMMDCCNQALEKIDMNAYAKSLDGYSRIYSYGISFYQKSALVRLKK